ncbi:hypothetical protein N7530_005557 [Penicillium desertorum]|uniref:Uncharacterized protein n=1 Tax=Penicillium desertorum TaxID=1303715 RepID=A0A9W9X083_9EURO|nr:hypothetical protein N7530_005557 [Penicillium desertorum]
MPSRFNLRQKVFDLIFEAHHNELEQVSTMVQDFLEGRMTRGELEEKREKKKNCTVYGVAAEAQFSFLKIDEKARWSAVSVAAIAGKFDHVLRHAFLSSVEGEGAVPYTLEAVLRPVTRQGRTLGVSVCK